MESHSASNIDCQGSSAKSPQHQKGNASNFEPLDKAASNTLKRNPKMELNKQDLLKLLSYLEGELEAREVVIAALKSEKVKQLLHQSRHKPGTLTQSQLALQQDTFAVADSRLGLDCLLSDHQIASLDNVILQHRRAQLRMAKLVKDMETRHCKVLQELDEEKQKHEHDTAQGDDITYGLEKERTRLKQELELEKQNRKKLEKDLQKANDVLEEERNRQKQIVLLLLAERKKLIMKYVEERKRSEDLAQIVSEEKVQMNAMADGLEEESKKSLQMEAELEKQIAQFDLERQHLKSQVMREQRRISELEAELEKTKAEQMSLHKQLAEAHQVAMFQATVNTSCPGIASSTLTKTVPLPPGAWAGLADGESASSQAGSPMLSSVAKVVQPTATVSSVPVCAPTTGIARSVSPGQNTRSNLFSPNSTTSPAFQVGESDQPNPVAPRPGAKLYATSVGGKLTFHGSAAAAAAAEASALASVGGPASNSTADVGSHCQPASQPQPPPKKLAGGRGAPPPVPPNKPIVPPKKDSVMNRKAEGVVDGTAAGAKLGLVSKEKAPQVGREPGAPGASGVDSLHAPARPASSHTLMQLKGSSNIAASPQPTSAATQNFSVASTLCAIQPSTSAPIPTLSRSDVAATTSLSSKSTSIPDPASSSTSAPDIVSSPTPRLDSISTPSSSTAPDFLPECVPSSIDLCSCPQLPSGICVTPKVDAV